MFRGVNCRNNVFNSTDLCRAILSPHLAYKEPFKVFVISNYFKRYQRFLTTSLEHIIWLTYLDRTRAKMAADWLSTAAEVTIVTITV